jgi:hypothetical protein
MASIAFQRVRHLSLTIATLEQDESAKLKQQLTKLLADILVPQVVQFRYEDNENDQRATEMALAILEIECLIGDPPSQQLVDLIADVELEQRLMHTSIRSHHATPVASMITSRYDAEDITRLAEWLVAQCGKQIGQCPFFLFRCIGRQPMPFQSVAVTLDCIARYSKQAFPHSIEADVFHVIALDPFFAQGSWTTDQVVNCAPFLHIIPLGSKIRLAQQGFERRRQANDKQSMYDQIYAGQSYTRERDNSAQTYEVKVSRETIVDDSIAGLGGMGAESDVDGIKVKFVGEEGQDQGGLTKEWFLVLCELLVSSVFVRQEEEAEYMDVRPECPQVDAYLMGIVLGLALQHQVVLDVTVAPHVHLALLEENGLPTLAGNSPLYHLHKSNVDLLQSIRPGLAAGLTKLLHLPHDQDADLLGVDFTFTQRNGDQVSFVELLPNGRNIPVNRSNKALFVDVTCRHLLETGARRTLSSMRAGFVRVCNGIASLNLLTTDELNVLIRGQDSVPSVEALQSACIVVQSSRPQHAIDGTLRQYMKQVWDVIGTLSRQDIKRLMHFVTASHRMPLVTHRHEARARVAPFTIIVQDDRPESSNGIFPLPTASTCSNTLFLPVYATQENLQRCLLYAIREGSQGFGRP